MSPEKKILDVLLNISNYVGSVMELDDILTTIVDQTAEAMNVPVCSIYLLEPEGEILLLRSTHGLNQGVVGKVRFQKGEGIPGWVVEHNQLLSLADGPGDSRFKPIPGSDEEAYMAYLCSPLRIQEEVIGCMTVRKREKYAFTESEIILFETICKQVAIVLEKSRLYFDKLDAEKKAIVSTSLSEIAHYIKNILQSMKGGSWFVENGLKQGNIEKAQNGWGLLRNSIRKISELVENMLNYSRPTNVNLERGNINALLVEIFNTVGETAQEKGIEIRPELAKNLPDIYFDWDRIHDAMLNLVTNAMDAIPDDREGLVVIRTWHNREKRRVVTEITDNGEGIPEENRERIFHLFFSTKGRRGTGIGLSVTKKIIEEHCGIIRLESEQGQGTSFIIELPVYEKKQMEQES